MHKSQVAGIVLVILGAAILLFLAGFIVHAIVTLIKLLAVLVGFVFVLLGIFLIVGRRYMRRGPWDWGSSPATT